MSEVDQSTGAARQRPDFDTVVGMFRHAVDTAADRVALRCADRTLTYAEYGRCVAGQLARLDGLGVSGGRVAIAMPNSAEMAVAAFAAFVAGAQVAFLNPGYPEPELRPLVADADPTVLISGSNGAAGQVAERLGVPTMTLTAADLDAWRGEQDLRLPRSAEPRPDDLATLMYTGGTTGTPKGAQHTHRNLLTTVAGMEACWPTSVDGEVWLNVAPMFHIWGLLMGLLNPVYGRATLIVVPRYEPSAVVADLAAHRVTVFSGGPAAIYSGLLAAPNFAAADLSALRVCPGGGSAFSPDLLDRWRAATGVPVYEAFGMSELAPISCNPWGLPPRAGSVGLPAPHVQLAVVGIDDRRPLPVGEVGEIRARAPHVTIGYRNQPEETAHAIADGWLYTGDLGRLDEDGYLYIVDRLKDMILVGGFNVYPREIDDVLVGHPCVAESATVGVDDDRKGERPVTFVTAAEGSTVRPDELHRYCTERLVDYKRPMAIAMLDAIPRTAANKIDRRSLRAKARQLPG